MHSGRRRLGFLVDRHQPVRAPLPLLVEVETGTIEPGTILNLKLVVRSPAGLQMYEQGQVVMARDSLVRRSRFCVALELSGSQPGLWRVQFSPDLT